MMTYSDSLLRDALRQARVIAVVGFSGNPARPSHTVARYLQQAGYRVLPVNPGLAGQDFLGEVVRPDLAGIAETVDMIDIFRRSEAVPPVVEAALERWPGLQTIWMQIGVVHPAATARAQARGCRVVQDRCTKIEHLRLLGGPHRTRPPAD